MLDPGLSAPGRILVVGDGPEFGDELAAALNAAGLPAEASADPREALDRLGRGDYALVVTDLAMSGLDGLELLRLARAISPRTEVVVVSGQGNMQAAIGALRAGAADFLAKPAGAGGVWELVGRLAEIRRLRRENQELRLEIARLRRPLLPASPAMRRTLAVARELARSAAPVLICGEPGSGRASLAELIHRESERCAGPLVKMNCSALPAGLHATELFGTSGRRGRMELAAGGTVYLHEVGRLSSTAQGRLLSVLASAPAGAEGARLLASASRDLGVLARAGRFMPELRRALSLAMVHIPPLRARPEDVPEYARHFLERGAAPEGPVPALSAEAAEMLCRWHWPGNVRELEGAMERAVALAGSGPVLPAHLPPEVQGIGRAGAGSEISSGVRRLAELEREAIRAALLSTSGNVAGAARELGVSRTSLYDRMARHGVGRPAHRGRKDRVD